MINEIDIFPINSKVYGIIHEGMNIDRPIMFSGKISKSHYDLHSPKYEVIVEKILSKNDVLPLLLKLKNKEKNSKVKGLVQNFYTFLNFHFRETQDFSLDTINKDLKGGIYKVVISHQHLTRNLQDLKDSLGAFYDVILEDKLKDIVHIVTNRDYEGMYSLKNKSDEFTFLIEIGKVFNNLSIGKKDAKDLDGLRDYNFDYKFSFSKWLSSMWRTYLENKKY